MDMDDIYINSDIEPSGPSGVTLPIEGKDLDFLFYNSPPPFTMKASPMSVSVKSGHAAVYRVEIEFKSATVERVVIMLKNKHNGIVADPGPIVSVILYIIHRKRGQMYM